MVIVKFKDVEIVPLAECVIKFLALTFHVWLALNDKFVNVSPIVMVITRNPFITTMAIFIFDQSQDKVM